MNILNSLVAFMLQGCSNILANSKIESALVLSGSNRSQLEAVLGHYADDSLKLKAAEFLIAKSWLANIR